MNDRSYQAFRFEGFTLNTRCRTLSAGDRLVDLRPKSFDVLCHLAAQAGRPVTKHELIAAIWPDVVVSDESLTRCISDIRLALGDSAHTLIKTLPRRGYQLTAPVQRLAVDAPLPDTVNLPSAAVAGNDAAVGATRRRPHSWRLSGVLAGVVVLLIAFASSAWWLRRPPMAPASVPPSVAVLPLVNLSGDVRQAYFSDGLTEELTVALSKFGHLAVIARSSAFQYTGKAGDARQIGQALGARYLLQGSVRRDSRRLRITAQLVDTDSNRQLWAEHYDSAPDAVFAVQDELVQKIVISLAAHISKAEIEARLRQPPDTLTAYDNYLRGNARLRGLRRETRGTMLAEARGYYQQAMAADPRYALALQALANTYLLAWLEPSPDHSIGREFQQPAILNRARSLAQQAVDLDASLAEAQATLGWILYWQRNMTDALAAFDRAFRDNPNLIDGRYAIVLAHGGRAPDAIKYAQRLMRLDPFYPPNYPYYLGKGYFFVGRYEDAFALIQPAVDRMPGNRPPLVLLAAVAALTGRHEQAQLAAAEVLRIQPDFTITGWLAFLRLSDQDYADRLTRGLQMAGLPE